MLINASNKPCSSCAALFLSLILYYVLASFYFVQQIVQKGFYILRGEVFSRWIVTAVNCGSGELLAVNEGRWIFPDSNIWRLIIVEASSKVDLTKPGNKVTEVLLSQLYL